MATKIGEIGALSWFWHFNVRGNRGNRDPLMVLALHPGKTLRGPLFHLFWWPAIARTGVLLSNTNRRKQLSKWQSDDNKAGTVHCGPGALDPLRILFHHRVFSQSSRPEGYKHIYNRMSCQQWKWIYCTNPKTFLARHRFREKKSMALGFKVASFEQQPIAPKIYSFSHSERTKDQR